MDLRLFKLAGHSELASRWVTSTVCWRQWCAVNMVLASIDVDVEFDELGVRLCGRLAGACGTVEVCVVFLDTLTPEFELYVRLRERRQWGNDFPEFVLLSLLFDFFLVERQLDLSSVTARLRVSVACEFVTRGRGLTSLRCALVLAQL
ncbi:hypothetical protein Taro_009444 [Colocasia esculenta]|uniref:Uncharacterized protein n=1 Tax=Colocasia esculenta TaxID=4460 RepID=A0A843U414_COLES|nr:hypothetical protein [Colocasia esculenta]